MAERWEDWFVPGETLLWEGAPAPGIRKPFLNIFFGIFGLPFLGAGLFVSGLGLGYLLGFMENWSPWHLALGVFLAAFGVPFIIAGGGMVFGTWTHDYLRPRRVRYALSNKNGYVASRFWDRKMEVFPIDESARIETQSHSDGTTSIWFHFQHRRDSDGDDHIDKKGFEALADGEEVYRMIRNLKAGLPVD